MIHEASALTTRAMAEAEKKAAVEAERNRWMQQVNSLNSQLSNVMNERNEISAAQAENTKITSKTTADLNVRTAELKTQQEENNRLKENLDKITSEKNAATANLAKISTDLSDKTAELKTKETEATKLKINLDRVAKERDSAKTSWAAAAKDAADKLAAAQQEVNRLAKERDDATAQAKQEQEKLTGEVVTLRSNVEAREAEKNELSAQVQAAEEARKQLEESTTKEIESLKNMHEQEVQRLNSEIASWTAQLNQKVDELTKVQQMAEESKKSYAGAEEAYLVEAEILRNEITQLKGSLETQLNNLKAAELGSKKREDEMQKEAEGEKKKLTDMILAYQETEIRLLTELDDLQTKLTVAEAEAQRKANENKIAIMRLTSQIKETVTKANQIKADYEAIIQASREAELRTLEYIDELSTELTEMHMANEELSQSVSALKTQYDNVTSQYNNALQESSKLSEQYNNALQERSKLAEQYNSALQEHSKITAERDSIAAQYNGAIQERSKIAEQYNSVVQERSKIAEERDKLNSRLSGTWKREGGILTQEEIATLFHNGSTMQSAMVPAILPPVSPVDFNESSRKQLQQQWYETNDYRNTQQSRQQQRYDGRMYDDYDSAENPQQQSQKWYGKGGAEPRQQSRQQQRYDGEDDSKPALQRKQKRDEGNNGNNGVRQQLKRDTDDRGPSQWKQSQQRRLDDDRYREVTPPQVSTSVVPQVSRVSTSVPVAPAVSQVSTSVVPQVSRVSTSVPVAPAVSQVSTPVVPQVSRVSTPVPVAPAVSQVSLIEPQRRRYDDRGDNRQSLQLRYSDRDDRLAISPKQPSYDARSSRPITVQTGGGASVRNPRRGEEAVPSVNRTTGPRGGRLTDLAVNTVVNTLMKLTNNNVEKTNAAMNLIGAGAELPSTVEEALSIMAEHFDPEVFKDAMNEITRRYAHRITFVSESLTHLYGANGSKLVYWTKETPVRR
jgi:hypothetical protein